MCALFFGYFIELRRCKDKCYKSESSAISPNGNGALSLFSFQFSFIHTVISILIFLSFSIPLIKPIISLSLRKLIKLYCSPTLSLSLCIYLMTLCLFSPLSSIRCFVGIICLLKCHSQRAWDSNLFSISSVNPQEIMLLLLDICAQCLCCHFFFSFPLF